MGAWGWQSLGVCDMVHCEGSSGYSLTNVWGQEMPSGRALEWFHGGHCAASGQGEVVPRLAPALRPSPVGAAEAAPLEAGELKHLLESLQLRGQVGSCK